MRVLHIFSNPHLTHGASVFEYRIAERLRADGIIFDYLVTGEPTPEEEARYALLDSRVFRLPLDGRHGLLLRELRVNREYHRFFKTHRYDVVYADTENALRAVHLLMARLAGVRVRVLHSHNTSLQTTSRASRLIARALRPLFRLSATHYFACSEAAADWLFPRSIRAQRRYEILKNGVDLARFRFSAESRDAARARYALEGALVIGHIGRFMPQKNHEKLIEIFAALHRMRPEARLLLVGDGPLMPEIRGLAASLGVAEWVIFAGNVDDVAPLLHAMDVFVMPSLFEGLPVTGVEAQAAGLCCLFSDAITPELKISRLAEYLPLHAEPETWARRVCALANAPREDASAEIERAGYSIEHTAARLRDFYFEHSGGSQV